MPAKYLGLKCSGCGADLEIHVAFDGCDWECEAGDRSGFGWEISLNCVGRDCGRVYPIGRVKKLPDFSPVASIDDKRKEVKQFE